MKNLESVVVVLHRFGLAVGQVFILWFSLDHTGRIVPRSLNQPWLQFVLFVLMIYLGFSNIILAGKDLDPVRLTRVTRGLIVLSIVLAIYNIATRQIQLNDGLVDTRILAGAMFAGLSLISIHKKPTVASSSQQ